MPIRVLLIESDECIVFAFAKLLAHDGCEVLTALNECDAGRHLCNSALDVVVLEPEVSDSWGRKLLTTLDRGDVPFVVVSRFSPIDGIQSEKSQWLTKPVSPKKLASAVYEAAGRDCGNRL